MSRVQIDCPDTFPFVCTLAVRITDINYGNHAGNDRILSMIHEARMQFLQSIGYSELAFDGNGLIMADAALIFKQELFYGETVSVHVAAGHVSRIGFDLFYKMEKQTEGKTQLVTLAKTAMICYDYSAKKIVSLTEEARTRLSTGRI